MTSAEVPVVQVDGLTKRFTGELRRTLRYAAADVRRELLRRPAVEHARPGERAALNDVSLEVAAGEALAVLGPNGAGKTTLLKVLYGVLKPDAGTVRIRGRAGALLELGTAFEPVLSGRENVLVAAAVAGLSPAEASAALGRIIDFSELDEAIDMPVRTYSSGMLARLGFSVAAHLHPDVLLIDEVLAVGDFRFQRKCVEHIRGFLRGGGALILVTHNAFLAQTVCDRGIVLYEGDCVFSGDVVEAVARYLWRVEDAGPAPPRPTDTGEPVLIDDVTVQHARGGPPRTGEPARVVVQYSCREPREVTWNFSIWTGDHWVCVTGDTDLRGRRVAGHGTLACAIPRLPLLPGTFTVRAVIGDPASQQALARFGYDGDRPPRSFSVEAPADSRVNFLAMGGRLMTLDVEWE